jgi:hypothetical protein
MNVTTIVLINGLWMTALSWEHWVRHYSDKGYSVIAANWPGTKGDIEQFRRDPSTYTSLGLPEVVDHYQQIIRELETPPINPVALPVLRIAATFFFIIYLLFGAYTFRNRHRFFDGDPKVDNDIPAVRHVRVEVVLMPWFSVTTLILVLLISFWLA